MELLSRKLQEEWALLMHHDTITGTSTQRVMDIQTDLVERIIEDSKIELGKLLQKQIGVEFKNLTPCFRNY